MENTVRTYVISLDRLSDIKKFVEICSNLPAKYKIQLIDSTGSQRINATSVLAAISAIEWGGELRVQSQYDIYNDIKEFIPTTGLTD